MINSFESHGLVGVPDCNITLGNEKIVIIKGPNGSGKTSLLRQITHPLSSHNRFNKLRNGITEGYTKMNITYRNTLYKIEHRYTRQKRNIQVLSYLSKMVGDEWVLLTDNGLVNKFKQACSVELEYDDFLYEILNIGIENKGIVNYTNSERLEYLKKILKMDILTEVKENVSNKFTSNSNNLKFISNKLKDTISIQLLNDDKKKLENEITTVVKIFELEQKELNTLENIPSDILNSLNDQLNHFESDINVLASIEALLHKYDKTTSVSSLYTKLNREHAGFVAKVEGTEERIFRINEEMMKLSDDDEDELKSKKEDLEKKVKGIDSKYVNNKYIDISIDDIYTVKNYITNILSILRESQTSDFEISNIMKSNEDIRDHVNKYKNILAKYKSELTELETKIEDISISSKFIEQEVHPKCVLPMCELAKEYKRQIDKLNLFNTLDDRKKELEDLIDRSQDDYDKSIYEASVINSIRNFDTPTEILALFDNHNVTELIDIKNLEKLEGIFINYVFYLNDMKEKKMYVSELDKIYSILDLMDRDIKDKSLSYTLELKELSENKNDYIKSINELNTIIEAINKNSLHISKYSTINYNMIDKEMNNLKEKYDDIKKEIKANEMKIDNMNRLTTSINENKVLIKTYQEKYNNIRNDIKNNNELTREFETMKDENNVIKVIRDIVSNDLPSRMLESYLNDISHMVNILLSDFMSIRFDVTDGIDIVCNRDGEERLSQNLSQGESSMLSIALLMTFKKSINWDIISIDEGSSVLDEVNKDRYIAMIRDYSETVNTLKQIFLVSHDYIIDSSADVKIITIGD